MLLNIKETCTETYHQNSPRPEKWSPPPTGFLKFNVDGSSKGNPGAAGVGGILRDSVGKVLGSFSLSIGHKDCISAELLAIYKAADLCVKTPSLHDKNVLTSSDSMTAVSWINGSGIGSTEHHRLILDIRESLCSLGKVSVIFNPRDTNADADALARNGTSGEGDNAVIWDFP